MAHQITNKTSTSYYFLFSALILTFLVNGCEEHKERINKSKVISTQANLMMLNGAINMFKLDMGRYPSQEKGLIELVEKPTDGDNWPNGGYLEIEHTPKDAWGNDFVYLLTPGQWRPFVVISYGADGKEGGTGYDADLYSWDR